MVPAHKRHLPGSAVGRQVRHVGAFGGVAPHPGAQPTATEGAPEAGAEAAGHEAVDQGVDAAAGGEVHVTAVQRRLLVTNGH